MESLGLHILFDLTNCDAGKLDDVNFVRKVMLEAADFAKATILHDYFHKFLPQGVSGAVIISESHLTIHTWPEHKFAALDFFSCGKICKPWWAVAYLACVFKGKLGVKEIKRGIDIK